MKVDDIRRMRLPYRLAVRTADDRMLWLLVKRTVPAASPDRFGIVFDIEGQPPTTGVDGIGIVEGDPVQVTVGTREVWLVTGSAQ